MLKKSDVIPGEVPHDKRFSRLNKCPQEFNVPLKKFLPHTKDAENPVVKKSAYLWSVLIFQRDLTEEPLSHE